MRFLLVFVLAASVWGQSAPAAPDQEHRKKPEPGAAREIGSGAGTVGVGAAKGAGEAGKGVAKGAGNLVTLHPIRAGESVGKGAAIAGKDVAVGTAKGTGKMVKGVGRAIKHLF